MADPALSFPPPLPPSRSGPREGGAHRGEPPPGPADRDGTGPGGLAAPALPPVGAGGPVPGPWRERLVDLRGRLALDWRLGAWALAAVALAGVGLWLLRPAPTPVEEVLPVATTAPPSSSPGAVDGPSGAVGPPGPGAPPPSEPAEVVAHAAGAVRAPGVYRLAAPARVDDLVRAAGGLAPGADGSRLNLAAPLTDGTRLYVPRAGEEVPDPVGPDGVPPPAGPGAGATGEGPAVVDLNTAGEAELDTLPGVGPATAAAIVAHREAHGRFHSVEDLLDVRGIGEAKLEQIRPLVAV